MALVVGQIYSANGSSTGNNYITAGIDYILVSQNEANLTSKIRIFPWFRTTASSSIHNYNNKTMTAKAGTSTKTAITSFDVSDATVNSKAYVKSGYPFIRRSGDMVLVDSKYCFEFDVKHNADGTLTNLNLYCLIPLKAGTVLNNSTVNINVDLPPIAQRSDVVSFNYTTVNAQFTIGLKRYNSSFTDTVSVSASKQGTTEYLPVYSKEKTQLTTISFTIDNNTLKTLFQNNKSATSVDMRVILVTWSGNESIGMEIYEYSNIPIKKTPPDVSATIIDTNDTTKLLTGNENVIVKYLSKPKVTINAVPKQEADIKSYALLWSSISSTTKITDFLNGVSTNSLTINATDTRNWDNPQTINLATQNRWIEYVPLNVDTNNTIITRPESTSSILNFKCNGNWFNGNFSSTTTNTLNLKYRWAYHGKEMPTEYTNITLTIDNNNFSCNLQLGDSFDYKQQVDFEFILSDLASSRKFTFNVESGKPIIRIAKDYVEINGNLFVNELPVLTATKVVTETDTDLNDYIEDGSYFFSGHPAPTNVPAGSNGWLVVMKSLNYIKQIWYRLGTINTNDFNTYVRTRNGSGNWSKWRRFVIADEIYYKSGDTYELPDIGVPFGGYLTGSRTSLSLATIFLPKSLKNINSITLNSIEVAARQNGYYLLDAFTDVSKINIYKISENAVMLRYNATSAITNSTNNEAVGVAIANLKITFN